MAKDRPSCRMRQRLARNVMRPVVQPGRSLGLVLARLSEPGVYPSVSEMNVSDVDLARDADERCAWTKGRNDELRPPDDFQTGERLLQFLDPLVGHLRL